MHSVDMDIGIKNLSKIEGHCDLDLKVRKGKVEELKLKIMENKRFYTQAVEGKPAAAAPQLMSRICGTCSIAHLLCCIEAVEKTFGIMVSEQTKILRKLSMYGLIIRDHALHLYFFSLPDVFNKDSILDFDENNEKEHELVHHAFAVKSAGNNLSKAVAGRAVHAPYPTVGGHLKVPSKDDIKKCVLELKSVRANVLELIEIFSNWELRLDRETTYVALMTDDFSFLDGQIQTSKGTCIEEPMYAKHLERLDLPYSTASAYKFQGGEYLVGALSRINLNKNALHAKTKKDAARFLKRFPSKDVFDNNVAQAIEILHAIDHSIEILESREFVQEKPVVVKPRAASGIGVIEAPRGTLYYNIETDEKGIITHAKVIVPTQQNQINIENDIRKFVEDNLEMDKEELSLEIEKIIRAYDPCMSCATHFLKIKWK